MKFLNDNIIKKFINNLQNEGKSSVSIKNYKSDISHFIAWAILKLKSFGTYAESVSEITPFISRDFFNEYKDYMVKNNIKIKTVNRRLSSLRNFSRFLANESLIDEDYTQGIQNVGIGNISSAQVKAQDIVDKFRKSLIKSDEVSENTIKNYASDIRSFLDWCDKKGNLPNGI